MALMDALIDEGHQVRDLIGDRHYSYKRIERWARPLWERGVHQVLDLREDEHGVRDVEGMKFTDGWAHCPGLPAAIEGVTRPGNNASEAERQAFAEKIERRWAYAMNRNKTVQADGGKTQWGAQPWLAASSG